ncbi:MAG TPA: hypothetical protein PK530_07785 [Anaerolineales bacterium]|nr:hypothetical protein [Anaerolineales bacterium]
MPPAPSFLGSWLVSEYIYNPDSSFAGINYQRRMLHQLENGLIRVTQICAPEPVLDAHPMGAFRGEWVFDLRVDGNTRHYLGPDVVGAGQMLAEGVMKGQGRWPRFGYDFTSFSILVNPNYQFTGGQFLDGERMVANLIGLAVPETEKREYPHFSTPQWPAAMAATLQKPTAERLLDLQTQLQRNAPN